MSGRKYNDHYDDPTWDPEDEAYGDYDEDTPSDGFSIYRWDEEEYEDDEDA